MESSGYMPTPENENKATRPREVLWVIALQCPQPKKVQTSYLRGRLKNHFL